MRHSDILSGCLLTALGLAMIFVFIPAEVSGTSDYGLAPDFFPVTLAWLFTGLAALLVVIRIVPALLGGWTGEDEAVPMRRGDWAFIAGAVVFLAVGYVAMERVGFVPAAIAVIAVLMIAMGGLRNWIALGVVSAATPFVIDAAFRHIFLIYLP